VPFSEIGSGLICQMRRVIERDWVLHSGMNFSQQWQRDGHDNNWLLVEFALALPFAVRDGLMDGCVQEARLPACR
jgi:hypothetical protein